MIYNINHFLQTHIDKGFIKVISLFLFWRISLVIFLIIAVNLVPLGFKDRFLGGGFENYSISPWIFSWANFDGEHYTSIAIFGYKQLEQAFFPLYPTLISILIKPFISTTFLSLLSSTLVGLLISNLSLLLALIVLWDLLKIDFSEKISFLTIITILLFPTSFYLVSVYNESLFLLLTIASFYSARKSKWFLAGVFGCFASGTRVFGILLLPALLIEAWQQKAFRKSLPGLFVIPLGLISYMLFQWYTVGDPLAFYHLQTLVGEQHQGGVVSFPQVIFRYLKMISSVDPVNPIYQTILLEFITGIIFFCLPIYGYFKKIRLGYLFFAFAGFLLPTIQGSLSSVPRYIIVLFPSFIALAMLISNFPTRIKQMLAVVSFIILGIEIMLFLRGYWVA